MTRVRQSAFTLVEMLVAISLLGLLGVISWRGLDHVLEQRARISRQDVQIERLIRTIAQIERDFDERIADALLAETKNPLTSLPPAIRIEYDQQAHQRLTVMRRHPDGTGTVTVVYRLDGGELVRVSTQPSRPVDDRVVMLSNVAAFGSRLLSQSGWLDSRELSGARALAVEISIEDGEGGRYTKVMPL